MLHNDRQITISIGGSRKATNWPSSVCLWSEFAERFTHPERSTETMSEYLAMPKSRQDDLKDRGGFVGGGLLGERRKAVYVTGRDVLALDLDSIPAAGTNDMLYRLEGLGCAYLVYSTRKHRPDAPRLRVLWPCDRTAAPDEYEPLLRKMAELAGILPLCDPSTFEIHRLMYWPSVCADGEYILHTGDKPFLSVDGVLGLYTDWRNIAAWPQVPNAVPIQRLAAKQGDPTEKQGLVGAFCRVYDVLSAMDAFLPDIYDETAIPGRYTFTGGSTAGGAVVYDEGKFLYSHHATDPCGGKLVNAFDLVRLHKFSEMDDEAAPGTPTVRMPSYVEMQQIAVADEKVAALLNAERYQSVAEKFTNAQAAHAEAAAPIPEDNTDWMTLLDLHQKTGAPLKTINNVWVILENDPNLKDKFALNEFAGRGDVLAQLPWSKSNKRRLWEDNDNQGLYWYLEMVYQITGNSKIDGGLSLHSTKHSFNEVTAYLQDLTWDGTPRLDRLFIDYLGAEDTPYTRAVTRKSFTAAVARAMQPGTKFDNMTILSGPQGIGKSTLLAKMSKGWFNDSIRTFEGKEASELLQGVWLVEISELDAFRRTDVARIKQFLSLQVDRFRAAYGRHVKEMPRCCVFFGTTNSTEYLQDLTGNRRFWPIDVGVAKPYKSVWEDLDKELDPLWAEAVAYWRLGESLYLGGQLAEAAAEAQEAHREAAADEGVILDFLKMQVPDDWSVWNEERRRMYWGGHHKGEVKLVPRDRVCAVEIWTEALQMDRRFIKNSDTARINQIIAKTGQWEKMTTPRDFYCYKTQRGFTKRQLQSPLQS